MSSLVAVQDSRGKKIVKTVTCGGRLPHYIVYISWYCPLKKKFYGVFTISLGFLSHPQLKVFSLKCSCEKL